MDTTHLFIEPFRRRDNKLGETAALSLVYVLPAVNMAQPAFPQASPVSLLSSLPVLSMPQKNQRWYDGSVPDEHIQYVRMCVHTYTQPKRPGILLSQSLLPQLQACKKPFHPNCRHRKSMLLTWILG